MSTSSDIWEVMAEEIGGRDHNPLESFVRNGRLAGVRFYAGPKRLAPEPVEFEICAITLSEALAMETRGEGAVKFIGGVPVWLHSAPTPRPRTLLDPAEPLAPKILDVSRLRHAG